MDILKRIALILCFCGLVGCASIVSSGPKTLPIMSQPDGATCEITNINSNIMIAKATTPYTAVLKRDNGFFQKASYKVKIYKEGFIPQEVEVTAGINGWYFGNIVFGGLIGILIVDPATGAMWQIHEENITVQLFPDTPDGKQEMTKFMEEKEKLKKEAAEGEKQKMRAVGGAGA